MAVLTQNMLKAALQEAKRQKQAGVIIWPNRNFWKRNSKRICSGEANYEYARKRLEEGKETAIVNDLKGIYFNPVMVVPVAYLRLPEKLAKLAYLCERDGQEGPIVMAPSNQVLNV